MAEGGTSILSPDGSLLFVLVLFLVLVPILNRIPIVSFFFDRKGKYISNRKLLILLKASIVIPSEYEPTPAQVNPPGRSRS